MGLEIAAIALIAFALAKRGSAATSDGGDQPSGSQPQGPDNTMKDVNTAIGVGTSIAGTVASVAGTVAGVLGGGGAAAGTVGAVSAAGGGAAAAGGTTAAATAGASGAAAAEGGAVAASVGGGLTIGAAAGIYAAICAVLIAAVATGAHFGAKLMRWNEWVSGGRTGAKRRAIARIALSEWDLFELFAQKIAPEQLFPREYVKEIADAQLGLVSVMYKPALPASPAFSAASILAVCRAYAVERAWAYEQIVSHFYETARGATDVEGAGIALKAGTFFEAVEEYCAAPSPMGIEPITSGFDRMSRATDTRSRWVRTQEVAANQLAKLGGDYETFVRPARLDGQARGCARATIDDGVVGEYFGLTPVSYAATLWSRTGLSEAGWLPPYPMGARGEMRVLSWEPGRTFAIDIPETQRLHGAVLIPAAEIVQS